MRNDFGTALDCSIENLIADAKPVPCYMLMHASFPVNRQREAGHNGNLPGWRSNYPSALWNFWMIISANGADVNEHQGEMTNDKNYKPHTVNKLKRSWRWHFKKGMRKIGGKLTDW